MLTQQIQSDLITALKAKDALRVSVLRMLISEMNYKKIDLQRELEDPDIVSVLQREMKKRNEAIESYKAGGRSEQADSEAKEAEILQAYLPKMMSEEEIRLEIAKIQEIQDTKDFGKVMKVVAPMFRGKADGAVVARIVKELVINSNS